MYSCPVSIEAIIARVELPLPGQTKDGRDKGRGKQQQAAAHSFAPTTRWFTYSSAKPVIISSATNFTSDVTKVYILNGGRERLLKRGKE